MAGNINPIYSKVGDIQVGNTKILTTANTALDGTGTLATIWTADATNGGYLDRVRLKPATHNAATTGTSVRFFINDGTTPGVTTVTFIGSTTLPATTEAAATGTIDYEYPIRIMFPPGYKLLAALGTTSTNGWILCPIGGKY